MKATSAAGTGSGPSRLGILGIVFVVVHLQSCGLSCFLDDSGIVTKFQYNCSATIQSANGVRSEVSTDNLMMFAGDEGPVFGFPEGPFGQADAREQWLRYLNRVLAERGGDEAFTAVYGTGPWCVIGVPTATATSVAVEDEDERLANETGAPLVSCPCGEECGNAPGVVPILEVLPPTAVPYVVDFGTVAVGSPAVREITFRNSGEGRLCLSPPSIHGSSANPDDFLLTPISGCAATPGEGLLVLEDADACQFRVTFTPSAPGPRSARVPGARGCGDFITLSGEGRAGQLTAAPAPACFTPPEPFEPCREVEIRIDNTGSATVSLISTSVTDSGPGGWQPAQLETGTGVPIDLGTGSHPIGPGEFVRARVQACELATDESALRVMHNGTDYGAPGSPTGDVDSGSPLVVRLLPPTSGCTP